MPVDVITETIIKRDLPDVYVYSSDPDNAPRWYKNIDLAEWRSTPPLQVGSRIAFVAKFLGKNLAYTYEVVELSPGDRIVMRTSEGPFPMETSYTWESVSEGVTKMQLRNRGEPRGFSRLVAPVMSMAMRRQNTQDLRLLKSILEQ